MIAPAARARTIGPTERTRGSARTASRPAAGGAPRPSPASGVTAASLIASRLPHHQLADPLRGARAVLDDAAEPPPREHGAPVAQVDELLEVGGDDESRDPPPRLLARAQ